VGFHARLFPPIANPTAVARQMTNRRASEQFATTNYGNNKLGDGGFL
jgi:hypothetical protein